MRKELQFKPRLAVCKATGCVLFLEADPDTVVGPSAACGLARVGLPDG